MTAKRFPVGRIEERPGSISSSDLTKMGASMRLSEPSNIIYNMLPVMEALDNGVLEALAVYIRGANGVIDPIVANRIACMIDQKGDSGGFALRMSRAPGVPPGGGTSGEKIRTRRRELKICQIMVSHGALDRGSFEGALEATMKELEIGKTTVCAAWQKHSDRLRGKDDGSEVAWSVVKKFSRT